MYRTSKRGIKTNDTQTNANQFARWPWCSGGMKPVSVPMAVWPICCYVYFVMFALKDLVQACIQTRRNEIMRRCFVMIMQVAFDLFAGL